MIRRFPILILLALCLPCYAQGKQKTLSIVPTEGPLKGQKIYNNSHALLIGVNKYPGLPADRQLDYAVADVDAVKKILTESYGFDESRVTVLKDEKATKAGILTALNALTDNTAVVREDRLIVYFSGHGQTVALPNGGEIGFIIPHDARVDLANFTNARPYNDTCIKMEEIWGILRLSPAKHTLFIADSCYSGLAVKDRSLVISDEALAALTREPALFAMAAGRSKQVSVELPDKGHGAFTYALLQALRVRAARPGAAFTVNNLFDDVQAMVSNLTGGKQTPHSGNYNTEGVFVFIPTGTKATVEAAPEVSKKPGAQAVDSVARILVTSNPPGAAIFVDGQKVPGKLTPATVELDLEVERNREVEIGVKRDGFKATVRKVTLARGKNPELAVNLDRAAAQAPVDPGKAQVPEASTSGSSLAYNWKQGASMRAKTTISIQLIGVPIELEEVFAQTITAVDAAGTATVSHETESMKRTVGGESEAVPVSPGNSSRYDRLGRNLSPKGQEDELMDADTYKLIDLITQPILPSKSVAPGGTWVVTLPNPTASGANMTLQGKLLGTETILGVNAWKIKQTGQINTDPDNEGDNKMTVDLTFLLDPKTGFPLKVDGTLSGIPGNLGVMTWKIKMQALEVR